MTKGEIVADMCFVVIDVKQCGPNIFGMDRYGYSVEKLVKYEVIWFGIKD